MSSAITANFITTVNRKCSPLLRLPAELRTQILDHALGACEVLIVQFETKRSELKLCASFRCSSDFKIAEILDITTVCRQIHSETHLLFFQFRLFTFASPLEKLSRLEAWLNLLTVSRQCAIRRVSVHVGELHDLTFWDNMGRLRGLKELRVRSVKGYEERTHEHWKRVNGEVDQIVGHHVDLLLEPV